MRGPMVGLRIRGGLPGHCGNRRRQGCEAAREAESAGPSGRRAEGVPGQAGRGRTSRWAAGWVTAWALVGALGGCKPPPPKPGLPGPPAGVVRAEKGADDLERYEAIPIGAPVGDQPWVAHLLPVDLDEDGRLDVVFCEAKANTVNWLRQEADGTFVETVLGTEMRAPVHVEAADIDQDGDLDLLVSAMGFVFPNNDKIGSILVLENDGEERFMTRVLIENIARVVDVRAADFNRDGLLDLAVGQFGYDQGEVRWMKRTGPWEFESKVLLELSGAINVGVADFDGNGAPDFAVLISQQWEEVHLFLNNGFGEFSKKVVFGSTNEDYSSSGMSVGDLNRDGKPDLIFSNGDGFGPTPDPGPKPWHGVQWLENRGGGFFQFRRIGDLGGAYSPVEADVDGDGAMDVVALASFNNWNQPRAEALVWFRNQGSQGFAKRVLRYDAPTHMITLAAGDFDGSGRVWLVTGGFHAYPPFDRQSRVLLWRPR